MKLKKRGDTFLVQKAKRLDKISGRWFRHKLKIGCFEQRHRLLPAMEHYWSLDF